MGFSDIVLKTWQQNILFSALLELTYRCNLDCYFCYNDLSLRGKPLSKEQYFDLLDGLQALGTFNLILSGGEPLAHPDFFAIGARAREMGFVIRIKSNGHALHGDMARRVREEVAPFVIDVSLHGARAETHDRQTRVPGSFDRLLANLEEGRALGLRFKINSTLTAWNEDEIEGMIALGRRLEIPLQIDPEVSPRDDGDTEPLSIRPSRQAVRRLFEIQAEARRAWDEEEVSVERRGDASLPASTATGGASTKHCGAGSATVAVDPFGSVYPCVQWRRAVGNLHERSIVEIWSGSGDLKEIRRATERVKDMVEAEGAHGRAMGFCPGNAVSQTGSPLGLYPAAAARKSLREQVAVAAQAGSLLPIVE